MTRINHITLPLNADYEVSGRVTRNKTPVDISGRTYFADVRADYDSEVLAAFTFDFVTDGTDGWYVRSMPRATVAALIAALEAAGAKAGVWDMFYLENGLSHKVMRGSVLIERSVSAVPGD